MAADPVFDGQYRRWEPSDLEHLARQQVKLPTAEELERIHQDAHREGYEAGSREGMTAGYEEGLAKAAEDAERFRGLVDTLAEALQGIEQSLAHELLSLSLDISKQMLTRALEVKPELLLPVIRAGLESLPQNAQHPHIHLHPKDAAMVREMLSAESHAGWRVIEDARIAPGGCRIETSTAEVDATLASRWQRIASALGQDNAWLADGRDD